MTTEIKIISIANAGVLISDGAHAVLIDALFTERTHGYSAPGAAVLSDMLNQRPPFDSLSAILFTHLHPDHADVDLFGRIADKSIPLIFPQTAGAVMDRITARPGIQNPMTLLDGAQTLRLPGVKIEAIPTAHYGGAAHITQHYSYLLTFGDTAIFVSGDAEPADEKLLAILPHRKIDTAVVIYPMLATAAGRTLITKEMKPAHLVLYHVPFTEDDTGNAHSLIERLIKRYEADLPQVTVLSAPQLVISAGTETE
ncbi:MAG: MBL fold metallo-hydrolase [Clostridiales Family XIII bacterium]|jgi:L-ascorbate metabolism protein UlaG (beta-lactamase superfamily)|nr:MBL fold metallo-hydrolase [Clostridiales Family XIII bacterium]